MNEWRMYQAFPALSECHKDGKRLVYLDSAATTQRPGCVIEEEKNFYEFCNANPLRGLYGLSEEATKRYASARETVANFMNALPEEIVFTRNATEGLNLVAMMLKGFVSKGDNVVVTLDAHHSNYLPWVKLCLDTGAELRVVGVLESPEERIDINTKVVALTHVTNVMGKIHDVQTVFEYAHTMCADVYCVLDMAQSVAHIMPDPEKLDADFAVFSGHKVYGPFGIGVLWGRKHLWSEMRPVLLGGEMVDAVTKQDFLMTDIPHRFEAGTPNVAGAVALETAIKWFSRNYEYIYVHEQAIYDYAKERLSASQLTKLVGLYRSKHASCIAFNVPGVHPHDVASMLADENICIRAGYMCCQPYLDEVNNGPCCRLSIGAHTTMVDIDMLCEGIEKVRRVLGNGT